MPRRRRTAAMPLGRMIADSAALDYDSAVDLPAIDEDVAPMSAARERLMQRSSVDLPEPEGPMMQITSAGLMRRSLLTPLKTS